MRGRGAYLAAKIGWALLTLGLVVTFNFVLFRILPGDFTETNGMLTPSLKVKRTVVAKEYADEIAAIYR